MSLINDMLRDLDARRSHPQGLDALALQGVGPTLAPRVPALPLGRLALGLALAVGLAAGGIQAWSLRTPALLAGAPALAISSQDMPPPARPAASDPPFLPIEAPTAAKDAPTLLREPVSKAARPAAGPVAMPVTSPAPATDTAAPVTPPPAAASPPPRDRAVHQTIRALSPAEQAQQRFDQGAAALQHNRTEQAQALLQEALDLVPQHSQARLALAGLWVRQQRIEPALDLLARGLDLEPASLDLARLRGHLLLQQGRLQEARGVLEAAAPAATAQADYQALLGTLYQRLGQHEQAVTHYRQAVQLQPDQGLWWLGLGVSLEQTRQGAAAREAFHSARAYPLSPALQQYVEGRLAALGH